MVPACDRDGVELNRAEPPEDLEHCGGSSLDGARGREQVASDEEAPGRVGGDVHRAGRYPAVAQRRFRLRSSRWAETARAGVVEAKD
jgi:hypothetical protein